ncbi:MAG: shikimate kinase [Verrucomicrobia bacterium]|nr:shikimate kinase [Verrucomicrobiota bacterium]MBT4903064.1 shikimate kinase [Verrucomicrobiota bacterium]MBT6658941.1 shikimate kinase [Verrucomicrobiota bacterium]MBT7910568.1 shikimate kinase [Verrucomicrobiota bacterium]
MEAIHQKDASRGAVCRMFPGVDANRNIRNIALTGFMGCGKTSVGRVVAKVAGFEFLDTDQFIEEHVGKSIPRIFEEHGEETFRRYEREVVVRLAERENAVIATGGGLLVDAENMDTMKQYAMVFCLWASPESIWRRVKDKSHRPLLQTENPKQRIIDLLEERKPAYGRSDMLINTEYRSARDVANLILGQFRQTTRKAK